MVTILLEQIIELLKGFIDSFKDHAAEVAEKLGIISEDTSDINDNTDTIVSLDSSIKDNTDILVANTGAIKNSSQATSVNTAAIASDTTVIRNNINTISTNSGRTAAFTEDTATNTLNILDKVTTIASDTTQMRSDNQVLISNTNDLETYVKLLGKGLKKTSYAEGYITSFNTDLKEGLTEFKLPIPVSSVGISSVEITNCKKNLLDLTKFNNRGPVQPGYPESDGATDARYARFMRIPSDRRLVISWTNNDTEEQYFRGIWVDRFTITDTLCSEHIFNDSVPNGGSGSHVIDPVPNTYILIVVWNKSGHPFDTLRGTLQVEDSEEVTTYEPFDGEHHKIEFGETLTDGAVLDVNKGILTRADGTTKQIDPLIVPSAIGRNEIYNDLASYNELGYNESIYNVIEREV